MEASESTQAAPGTATAEPTPNRWCIIRGTPGTDPLTIVGPFDTSEEATEYQQRDTAEATVPATVDVLIAPANC